MVLLCYGFVFYFCFSSKYTPTEQRLIFPIFFCSLVFISTKFYDIKVSNFPTCLRSALIGYMCGFIALLFTHFIFSFEQIVKMLSYNIYVSFGYLVLPILLLTPFVGVVAFYFARK